MTWYFQVRLNNENCQSVALIIYEKYPQGIPVMQTFFLSQKQFYHTEFSPSLFLMTKGPISQIHHGIPTASNLIHK